MKALIASAILCLSLTGCFFNNGPSSPGCIVFHGIDKLVVNGIADKCSCKNPAALEAWIQGGALATDMCVMPNPNPSASPAARFAKLGVGPVSQICAALWPELAAVLLPPATGAILPPEAQCDNSCLVGDVSALGQTLCGLIPAAQTKKPDGK